MENNTHKEKNYAWLYVLGGSILLIAAVVLILLYFMTGSVTVSDNGGGKETTESLACEGEKTEYPFFKHTEGVDGKSMKVNAVFNDDKLETISFVYKISYKDKNKDPKEIEQTKTSNYFDVTKEFEESGLTVGALGVSFSTVSDGVQMSLYADSKGLSSISSKFLMLDSANGSYRISNLKKIYENLGLKCVVNK